MLGFYRRLENSHKPEVAHLFKIAYRDNRTTTDANSRILENIGVDLGLIYPEDSISDINLNLFKNFHRFAEVPNEENYRLNVLNDLLSIKTQFSYFEEEQFSIDDINVMIKDICTT